MTTLTRRQLIESATLSLAAASAPTLSAHAASSTGKSKPIVYWTPEISSASLQRMSQLSKKNITGKVALKLHTGEPNGPFIENREETRVLMTREESRLEIW